MNSIMESIITNEVIANLGWTLIHFTWQAMAVAIVVHFVACMGQTAQARFRYSLFVGGLVAMTTCPILTYTYLAIESPTVNMVAAVEVDLSPTVINLEPMVMQDTMIPSSQPVDAAQSKPFGVVENLASVSKMGPQNLASFVSQYLPILVALWFIGVAVHLMRLAFGLAQIGGWRKRAMPVQDRQLQNCFDSLAKKMGIVNVAFLCTDELKVSAVVGLFKPAVLMPSSMISGLSMKEIELVVAHELAHVRRYDFLVNVLQKFVESVFFFHPAIWWLSKCIVEERENCCDDIAAEVCNDRISLAKALASMETIRCENELAIGASSGALSKRIRRLLLQEPQPARFPLPVGLVAATLVVVMVCLLLPGTNTSAASKPEVKNDEEGIQSDVTEVVESFYDEENRPKSKPESVRKDPVTGLEQRVFENIRLRVETQNAKTEVGVDLKYSNVIPYTFIPERISKSLQATKIGEIDFAKHKKKKLPENIVWQWVPSDFANPRGMIYEGVPGTFVDYAREGRNDQNIVPYPNDPVYTPDHLGFYGMNKTKQTKFDVVRIDQVDLGLGKKIGPVNALVLSDDNSAFGLLGRKWASMVRGQDGETLWHAAVGEFHLRAPAKARVNVENGAQQQKGGHQQKAETDEKPNRPTVIDGELTKALMAVEADEGIVKRIALKSLDVGRSATELIRHFSMSIERHGSPERVQSITNMESIASAIPTKRFQNLVEAQEFVMSLPEGSDCQATITGEQIKMNQSGDSMQLEVTNGKFEWIDPVGVIRAVAKPDGGAEQLLIETKIENQEVVFVFRTRRIEPSPEYPDPPVQVVLNLDTGAPADEDQPPHRSVRYEMQDFEKDGGPRFRLKMKWRYDVAQLAKEAETESGKTWEQIIWGDDYNEQSDENRDNESDDDENIDETTEVLIFNLQFVSVNEAFDAILNLSKDTKDNLVLARISKDLPNSRLVVSGSSEFLGKARILIDKLDQPPKLKLPWRVFGAVTDSDGKPLSGVEVNAYCGMGSLRRTGSAVTGADGSYDFRFGPGGLSSDPQFVQAATISVAYADHVEKNLHRHGDMVAAFEKPDGEIGWGGKTDEQLFLPGKPIEINFVMVPSAKLIGQVVDGNGNPLPGYKVSVHGDELPPSSSVASNSVADKQGRFELNNIPCGFEYQILVRPPKRGAPWVAWATTPISFGLNEASQTRVKICPQLAVSNDKEFEIADVKLHIASEGINWKSALKERSKRNELSDGVDEAPGYARIQFLAD